MGNNASRNETRNARSARKELTEKVSKRGAAAVENDERITRGEDVLDKQATTAPHQVSNSAGLTAATGKRSPVEVQQQQQLTSYQQRQQREQRSRQQSNWSFGSLSGRLNWSFTGGASNSKSSFRHRNKSALRKSFNSLQQKRSKTSWHRPLTNAIFSSHFKETSRNEQFHIDSLIAKGAFGVVFKVIDKQSQQLERNIGVYQHINAYNSREHQQVYALKVLKKSKIIADNSVQQLKDEADIQKLCGHHPFIVRQFDLWQNRRNLHILSEFVPNEIALAIDFLHNAGIIYRDAKPENILLNETFHIKLTDFGLSKWLKLGSTTKTMCGTFQYMGTIHELN